MWDIGILSIDLKLLLGLSILVCFDLTLRYLLFGRLESAAIDAALFATAYSVVEAQHSLNAAIGHVFRHSDLAWLSRAIGCGLILVLLALIHALLARRLHIQIAELYDWDLLPNAVRPRQMRAAKPLIMRSVLVTFVGPNKEEDGLRVRQGKQKWRTEVIGLINRIGRKPGAPPVTDKELLLPPRFRRVGATAFAVLGTLSLLVPTVDLHSW